jgi:putative ABC transport system permease protein
MFHVLEVDDDYLKTMDIEIVQGVGFKKESALDDNAFLVNRALAENLSWQNPVGKKISRDGEHTVIGVVDDFHFAPMHVAVSPLIITRKSESGYNYLSIRLKPGHNTGAIESIEKTWMQLFPSEPFNYTFLANSMKSAYSDDQKFGQLFISFTLLAIFLACLGLFGLASFLAERRRKEIGVRKTFGASSLNILFWLGKDFSVLVLAGNLIAWPIAWLAMQRWLDNFAYKIPLHWWIFAVALAFSLLITFVTVAWQSLKASHQNPVESLRYE